MHSAGHDRIPWWELVNKAPILALLLVNNAPILALLLVNNAKILALLLVNNAPILALLLVNNAKILACYLWITHRSLRCFTRWTTISSSQATVFHCLLVSYRCLLLLQQRSAAQFVQLIYSGETNSWFQTGENKWVVERRLKCWKVAVIITVMALLAMKCYHHLLLK